MLSCSLKTTQDNLDNLMISDELLSLVVNVVVFINDNAGQLGQPLLWSDELLSLVVNVVVFINDNAGQLGTTIIKE